MIREYRYEEIEAGMEERFQVEITAEKMELFRQITGDINPLHCDREFAQSKGYRDCVVWNVNIFFLFYFGWCLSSWSELPSS